MRAACTGYREMRCYTSIVTRPAGIPDVTQREIRHLPEELIAEDMASRAGLSLLPFPELVLLGPEGDEELVNHADGQFADCLYLVLWQRWHKHGTVACLRCSPVITLFS